MVEQGKKKAVAVALDWPGWNRSGKSEAEALQTHAAYSPRYAKVAALAGLAREFNAAGKVTVVERLPGVGMTDFYGLSFRATAPEYKPMSSAECERKIALLRACWKYFDDVASHVSAELRKGARGGGRDRDRIIEHTNRVEILDFAKKVGVTAPDEAWLRPKELRAYRDAYCAAIRDYNSRGAPARTWPVQF